MISDALVSHIKQSTSEQLLVRSQTARSAGAQHSPTPIHLSTSCPFLIVLCFPCTRGRLFFSGLSVTDSPPVIERWSYARDAEFLLPVTNEALFSTHNQPNVPKVQLRLCLRSSSSRAILSHKCRLFLPLKWHSAALRHHCTYLCEKFQSR